MSIAIASFSRAALANLTHAMRGNPFRTKPRQPKTESEWHVAVELAQLGLFLAQMKALGIIKGGIEINTRYCEALLNEAQTEHHISPSFRIHIESFDP